MDKEKTIKILKKANELQRGKELFLAKEFVDLNEKIDSIPEKIDLISEELKKKLESELVLEIDREELKGDKGEDGKDGTDGKDYILTDKDKKEIASSIKVPIVEKVIEKIEVIKEPIVTNEIKEVAKHEDRNQIVTKINLGSDKDIKIEAKQIIGLPEFTREVVREVGTLGQVESPLKNATTGKILSKDASGAWLIPTSGGGNWGSITGTLSDQTDLQTVLNTKQATLVSGTNIKTVNGSSLLGSGDLTVSASAGGSNTQVQFNDGGSLGGDAGLTYDKSTDALTVTGSVSTGYFYTGGLSGTYGGYSGGKIGGTATHAVLDFVDNNTRVGEFYTTSSAFNFFTGTGVSLNFYTNNDTGNAVIAFDTSRNATFLGNLYMGSNNTYDIGGGSFNPRSGYFGTSLTAPYLYGGNKTGTVYSGYSGAVLGGTATHAVLDFFDNNSRIGEFYTTSSAFNFFTGTGVSLNFYTNNDLSTPVISALSGGNVGIGTGAPSYLFHVLKTQNASTSITIENQSGGASAAARLDLARSFGADLYGTLYYAGDGNTVKISNSLNIETANGSDGGIFITTINSSAPIVFSTANTTRWKIGSNGHFIAPTDNTYDIGVSGATRPRTGYFGTKVIAPLIESTSTVRLKGFTVATLPAGTAGDTAYVTDALAPTYLTAIVGGGAIVTPVFFDGTNWVAH